MQNRERTKTKKSTSTPVWNANYFFYIPPEQSNASFDVDLYDWSLLGSPNGPNPDLLPLNRSFNSILIESNQWGVYRHQ